jgi:glycosyltransferase involved in cell wall biosynthesis
LKEPERIFRLITSGKLTVEEAKTQLLDIPDTLINSLKATNWWLSMLLTMFKYGDAELRRAPDSPPTYYFGEKAIGEFDGMRVFHVSEETGALDEHKGIVTIRGYYSDFADDYASAVCVNGIVFPEQLVKIRPQISYAGEQFFVTKTVKFDIDLNSLLENSTEPLEVHFIKTLEGQSYAWERIDVSAGTREEFASPVAFNRTLIRVRPDNAAIEISNNPDYVPYPVAVIIPMHNSAQHLRQCLDSVFLQKTTYDFQVLIVDDKSTDGSRQICEEYLIAHSNIRILQGHGQGIGAARNVGLRAARAKYLMFVNADDHVSATVIQNCVSFLEKHHETCDIVTYPEDCFAGKSSIRFGQYRYAKLENGVYDVLTDATYLSCLGVNVVIKNEGDVFFRESPKDVYEDVEFCADIIKKKYRVGFVNGPTYYRRTDSYHSVTANDSSVSTFEPSLACFERILASGDGDIHYFAATVLTLLEQKLSQNNWLPCHYQYQGVPGKYEDALDRARRLVSFIDAHVVMMHPDIPALHKAYWISFAKEALVTYSPTAIRAVADRAVVLTEKRIQVAISRFYRENELLTSFFMLRTAILNYTEEVPEVSVIERDFEGNESRRTLDLTISLESWFGNSQTQTNKFLSFRYSANTNEVASFNFIVKFRSSGHEYDTYFYAYESSGFAKRLGKPRSIICGDTLVTLRNDVFYLERLPAPAEYPLARLLDDDPYSLSDVIEVGRRLKQERRIWLYTDMFQAERDNARFQFDSDFCQDDGIEKYYIVTHGSDPSEFDEDMRPFLIEFNSRIHRILFCAAEKVFSSFCGSIDTYTPFSKAETNYVTRAVFPEIVYLQHGILHARMKSYNNMRRNYDRVVISSEFERENFSRTYDIPKELLLPFGMARFDMMDKQLTPKNKILFAPSWRSNLVVNQFGEQRELIEGKLLSSEYWRNIDAFLSNEELRAVLERNRWELEVKLHPIIESAGDLIASKYPHIRFIKEDDEFVREDYSVFITDFSSFAFDFVYLERAIMYFVPDYEIWRSGKNHYNRLDIEYDEAFGALTTTSEDAVRELGRLVEQDGRPDQVFLERMQSFFLHEGGKNRQMLYDEMIKTG